jgi:hypothetical protein
VAVRQGTKTITLGPEHKEPTPESFGQRKKPESGQFRLQVDRQTKSSYTSLEAAERAALAIKKNYINLHVTVYDAGEGVNRVIELPS